MKILIKNGRLIDPASGRDEPGDVAIAAGRILTLGRVPADFQPNRVIDATGCIVAPGLVDLAARLREPGPPRGRDTEGAAVSIPRGELFQYPPLRRLVSEPGEGDAALPCARIAAEPEGASSGTSPQGLDSFAKPELAAKFDRRRFVFSLRRDELAPSHRDQRCRPIGSSGSCSNDRGRDAYDPVGVGGKLPAAFEHGRLHGQRFVAEFFRHSQRDVANERVFVVGRGEQGGLGLRTGGAPCKGDHRLEANGRRVVFEGASECGERRR